MTSKNNRIIINMKRKYFENKILEATLDRVQLCNFATLHFDTNLGVEFLGISLVTAVYKGESNFF